MMLLVLGGTRFLSREVATQAVARGWDVTCACRGTSGPVPEGATHLPWDRTDAVPAAVADGGWDAVVDVARLPSQVRSAVAATSYAHWVFVSTVSVYADSSSPAMEPLLDPITGIAFLAGLYALAKSSLRPLLKLGAIAYWLFFLQQSSYALYEYFGGGTRGHALQLGAALVVGGAIVRSTVIQAFPSAFWFLTVS